MARRRPVEVTLDEQQEAEAQRIYERLDKLILPFYLIDLDEPRMAARSSRSGLWIAT